MKTRTLKSIRKERLLTDEDKTWHLTVNKPAGRSHASAMAIRMNSTYLEVVDGDYPNRGAMSVVGMFIIGVGVISTVDFIHIIIWRNYFSVDWDHSQDGQMFLFLIFVILIFSLLIWGAVSFNRWIGEWFGYTHYPIRLNRKNRMVYVFRGDGTVLETPWDTTYFTLYVVKNIVGMRWLGICGLVMKDAYTHYPIRLNRRNRTVYVFRGDGTALETPWDTTYFTLNVAKNILGMRWLRNAQGDAREVAL